MKTSVLILALSLLASVLLAAQAQPAPVSLTSPVEAQKTFDPAAATQAWLASVPAEKRAKSDAYFEGGYWVELWKFLIGAAIAIFLLSSGLSARLRDFAERTTRFKTLQVALYAIPFVLLNWLLALPLYIYTDY